MTYLTYLQMKTKVEQDLDIESEDFIQTTELLAYFNDAIREAEATIHKLGAEDIYFLSEGTLNFVNGTAEYALPSDIYANKIREIVYKSSNHVYEIKRMRSKRMFVEAAFLDQNPPANPIYRYYLKNTSAATGVKIRLVPKSQETSSNGIINYIRAANKMVDDTSICDIPEFYNFIYAVVKGLCKQKENMGTMPEDARAEIEMERKLMTESLENMVPDQESEIEKDITLLEEMS